MSKEMKYLYLDDNDQVTRQGDVELFNNISKRVEVNTEYPSSWKQRAGTIFQDLKNIDGIILDWELTNKSEVAKHGTSQAEDVDFSAESLAEHLRINVVQNKVKDIPIILCSADKNKAFSDILKRELTSRDLFDLTFMKSDLFVRHVRNAEAQLYDLAVWYSQLQNIPFVTTECLAIDEPRLRQLDIRFIDQLQNIALTKTAHDLVHFFLNQFILKEGILIDELVLAARLGIDIKKSGQYWGDIKSKIIETTVVYRGALSNGWERFWSFELLNWWETNFGKLDLRSTSAKVRVEMLNKHFGLNLVFSEKIRYTTSDEFWTVCFGTKKPLDPTNGFIIGDNTCNPWLEMEYVSAFAELEKEDLNAWRINVIDRERFQKTKTMITKAK